MADPFAALIPQSSNGQWVPGMPVQPLAGPFDHLIPTQQANSAPAFDPREHGIGGAIDATVRTLARGVPVLGQAADEGSAAVNATLAPLIEPLLDKIPGHNKANDIAGSPSWQDRFSRSVAMQRAMDAQVDKDHPVLSTAGKIAGAVGGSVAGGQFFSPVSGLLAKYAPSAGLLPTMLANGADGALVGGSMGYLDGTGDFGDQSRTSGAKSGAMFGGAAGAAVAPATMAAKGIWNATGRHVADALAGPVRVGAPPPVNPLAEALIGAAPADTAKTVQDIGQEMPMTAETAQPDLAEALLAQAKAPSATVPASAANAAYDRVYQSIARSGATPDEAIAQAQKLGPFGMLADTSVPMTDLARTVADAPGQSGQIAKDALNLRQSGDMVSGQYTVRPSSQRIADTLAQALGVSDRGFSSDTEALLAQQKAAAGPAYAKAYAAPPVATTDLQDFASSPMFGDAYNRARAISQKEFVTLPDGSEKIVPIPSWEEVQAKMATKPAAAIAPPAPSSVADDLGRAVALQDIKQYGSGRSGNIFGAIQRLGGVKLRDANGVFVPGPDLGDAAYGLKVPGLINNRSGMSGEHIAQALADDGWFGANPGDPSRAFEQAFADQANGRPVYHPASAEPGFADRAAQLDEELTHAGVNASDPPAVAAKKLFAFRNGDAEERAAIQWEGNLGDPHGAEFDRLSAPQPPMLDWRTLDLMKQGMDDTVREGKVAGIGANEQRATTSYIKNFVSHLDSLNPDYAPARAAFAGPASALDAMDAGRAYMKEDAPVVGAQIAALSPSEQQSYRVGALQAERDRLGSVPTTYNAAMKAGVNTPNRLAKLQQLFPDAETYGKYVDMLGNEKTMFDTRARVLGGSLTSRNLAHQADAEMDPLEMAAALGEVHHNPVGGVGRFLGMVMKAGNGQGLNEPTANAAASILFNNNPSAFPQFQAGLSEAAKRAALAKALSGSATPASAAGANALADLLRQGQSQ